MSTNQGSDLDDFFDLEQRYDKSQELVGYQYGLELGENDGRIEGYAAGYEHGKKRASEIGYYLGFVTAWTYFLQLNPSQSNRLSRQVLNKLEQLVKMVDHFPRENNESAEEKLMDIRARFKQVTSMLKLDVANFMYA